MYCILAYGERVAAEGKRITQRPCVCVESKENVIEKSQNKRSRCFVKGAERKLRGKELENKAHWKKTSWYKVFLCGDTTNTTALRSSSCGGGGAFAGIFYWERWTTRVWGKTLGSSLSYCFLEWLYKVFGREELEISTRKCVMIRG